MYTWITDFRQLCTQTSQICQSQLCSHSLCFVYSPRWAHPLQGQRLGGSAACWRKVFKAYMVKDDLDSYGRCLRQGESGIKPGAVTHCFPPHWPPMLFPPRLQRLELVKLLSFTDLNSSYSPQKTLSWSFFFLLLYTFSVRTTCFLCINVPSCTQGSFAGGKKRPSHSKLKYA